MSPESRGASALAGLLVAGCSAGSQLEWLDADELGPARSIITVFDGVRRAHEFDLAEGLELPFTLGEGEQARFEVHAMEQPLDVLRISPGIQLGTERGPLLPLPIASYAINLGGASPGGWSPTDPSAIHDLRSHFDCSAYESALVPYPDDTGGYVFGVALDDGDLFIGNWRGDLYRYSFDDGFERVDAPGLTGRLSAATRRASGSLVLGDSEGAIFEARLEANTLVRTASLAASSGWVSRLVIAREVPLELVAIADRGSISPVTGQAEKEVLWVRLDGFTVLESPAVDLGLMRVGDYVYSFSQEGARLRRVEAGLFTTVSIPTVAGIGSVSELSRFGLVIGTADGALLWPEPGQPSGWKTVPISGVLQQGNIVESVFEWGKGIYAIVRSGSNVLYELDLPSGVPCERLVGVPDRRAVPVGQRLVSIAVDAMMISALP